MATSGSTDFNLQRDDIIKGALRDIGVLRRGQTPPADEIQDASDALNLIIKTWSSPNNRMSKSFKAFVLERQSLTLTAKISFALKSSGGDLNVAPPMQMLSVVRKDTSNKEVPLSEMTLGEYRAIPDKTATGTPTKWHYEREHDQGKLYFNRVTDDTTDTMELLFRRELEDVDAAGDDIDVPKEWLLPLRKRLGISLAPEYGKEDVIPIISGELQAALEDIGGIDEELVIAYFEPGRDD